MLKVLVSNREGTLAGAECEYCLEQAAAVAGSEPGVDIHLDDPSVAARHFELFEKDGVIFLQDRSRQEGYPGTRLNGLVLEPQRPVPLRERDVIEAGVFSITLGGADTGGESKGGAEERSACLEFLGRESGPRKLFLPPLKSVQLGRSPQSDIVIADATVSRRHALVFVSGGNYYIRDEASANGSFVNGRKLCRPRRLRHGDFIVLGKAQLRFLMPKKNLPGQSYRREAQTRWLLQVAGLLGLVGAVVVIVSLCF
jgi:pSer/pThr/pTyr-binding forkhead associated (FHA) protein